MTSLTRNDVSQLRIEIDAALAEIAKRHNLLISLGNCRFSATEARFSKVTVRTQELNVAPGTNVLSVSKLEEQDYLARYAAYGLPAGSLHRKFTLNGKVFEITGLKPSRKKYPVSGKSVSGRNLKFTASAVIRGYLG